ncbi:FeoB-associated Cys-rich membrane protein [Psychromonas sp. KJ10-10]|uniref:FeoB-associated Cys-rich membrane protein n=1 Tax=Psychromonas sp. KJ10-10 TaxID=3391823 RepID=UPI0039B4EBAF
MTNIIVSLVIIAIIALAIVKIISEKRKGVKCIGCADSGKCSSPKVTNKVTKNEQRIEIIEVK